ncbi:GNAT family N-acetyltransferase [Morganella morganii]
MLIRTEIPVDAAGIDTLLRSAFGRDNEADLLHSLREDGLLTLGVVATDDEGLVVGYAGFTPVDVEGEDCQWVGLAPLAVAEAYRGQGIAKQMVYEGLDSLNEFGYGAVVVLGDPEIYGKWGFKPAAEFDLHCKWLDTAPYFLIYPLENDAADRYHGLVNFSHHFDSCE